MALYKPVGVDEDSRFPPRVEEHLLDLNAGSLREFYDSSLAILSLDDPKYGAPLDNVSSDSDALDALFDDLVARGGGYALLPPSWNIRIDRTHTPPEQVYIIGCGKNRTRVNYAGTYGLMAFDVRNPDCGVMDMTIEQVGPDLMTRGETGQPSARALGSNSLGNALYMSNHRQRAERLRVVNFGYGIRIDNYDVDGLLTNTIFAEDLHLDDIEMVGVHSGLIGRGHDRPYINNIWGTYGHATYGDPPHLIYLTGQSASPSLSCKNVVLPDARAFDGLSSDAFKFGGIKGGNVGLLYAFNCPGVLTLADSEQVTVTAVVSKHDLTPASNQALTLGDSVGVTIGSAMLHIVGNGTTVGRGVNIGPDGQDCTIRRLEVDYRERVAGSSGAALRFDASVNTAPTPDVLLSEPLRVRVDDLVVYGDGTTIPLQVTGGRDCSVGAVRTKDCLYVASISGSFTSGFQLSFEPDLQDGIVNAAPLVLSSTTGDLATSMVPTRVRVRGGTDVRTITVSGTAQIYTGKGETTLLRVQTTTGTVRPTPNSGTLGQRLTLQVWNDTAGAMSTVDWTNGSGTDNWVLTAPWTNPAPGERASITFVHDGTIYREVSRSAVNPGLSIKADTSTAYTAVLTDAGLTKLTTLSNAAAITYTIPPNSSVAFPVGAVLNAATIGAGQVTITQGAGVTFIGGAYKSARTGAMWSAVKVATDTWVVNGDLTV